MHRFYSPQLNLQKEIISIIDKDEIHHIKDVLRRKEGDLVTLFNGQGIEAEAIVQKIDPAGINLKIQDIRMISLPSASISLACAIPKKAKFETIIEKCTELGVSDIIPLLTKRTNVRFDEKQAAQKLKRYQTIAVNASKQCQRPHLPVIHPITNFTTFLASIDKNTFALIPCLLGERKLLIEVLKQSPANKRIVILIGPEGDFTPDEIQKAINAGCQPVSLGANILKVDTAAIATVAVTQFLLNP